MIPLASNANGFSWLFDDIGRGFLGILLESLVGVTVNQDSKWLWVIQKVSVIFDLKQ
jgi:hypothetical protein